MKLPSGYKLKVDKSGKAIVKKTERRQLDTSAQIRERKSKKQKYVRRVV